MKSLIFLLITLVGLWAMTSQNAYSSAETDSLQRILDTLSNDEQRMKIMIELGDKLSHDLPNESLIYYNSALILAENQNDKRLAYSIHLQIGKLFTTQEKHGKAVNAYRKAAEIADSEKSTQLQSEIYLHIGEAFHKLQKFDVAIPYFLKAKRIFEAEKQKKSLGLTFKKIAESYQAKKRTDVAIQYNLSALETLNTFQKDISFAETLENLGELYFENSEYSKSINYYKRSIRLFEKLNSSADFEFLYQQLGTAQKLMGEESEANASFQKAEEHALAKKEKDKEKEALQLMADRTAIDSINLAAIDTVALEDTVIFEEEMTAISDSDAYVLWPTPKLDNKPSTTQTISSIAASDEAANTSETGGWKKWIMTFLVLTFGVVLGFLWCIRQYKKKWSELQKYMENKDEKLLQQSKDIKTLEKELQFFNHALYKGLQMPATDVKLHSNLLKEKYNGSLDKEGSKYIKQIQKSATNLEGLLAAIFNFQQIKHYQLHLKEVNVTRIAQTITTELKTRYPKREIRFWVQEDMKIRADEELVRLLLANLLHNAVKFTQKNPIAIIEFGKKEHIFYVKDNGEGFHPQEAKVMFETFEPLKNTKNFEELTVSLLSMQTIVEKHAGIIWAISQKEKGATFFFTLDATPVENETKDFWNLSKSPHFKLML